MPGLRWKKLDLHVHTPASECFVHPPDRAIEPTDIVMAALGAGLDGIAITDHMTGAWIDPIKEAASEAGGLLVFPGVELSVDYYHVIALFSPEKGTKDIEALLGELKLDTAEHGKASPPIKDVSPTEVFSIVHRRGGLVVLAHIDCQYTGAFAGKTKGNVRIELLNSSGYDAVEIQGDSPPEELYNAKIAKSHGYTGRPAWYRASDNPAPEDSTKHSHLGVGSRFTWFSGEEEFALESLRQCFNDPSQRISVSDDSPAKAHPAITHLDVRGGFLDGVSVEFHRGLTSIVGGKGVGKSLIVEFLRLALGDVSTISAIAEDHKGKIVNQLEAQGELRIELVNEVGVQYGVTVKITSADASSKGPSYEAVTQVADLATGQPVDASSAGILPIRAFSQGEIIEISREKSKQLIQLDSFVDLQDIEESISKTLEELKAAIRQLVHSRDAQASVDDLRKRVGTHEERVKSITKSLQAKAFSDYQEYEKANKAIAELETRWEGIATPLREAKEALSVMTLSGTLVEIPAAQQYARKLQTAQTEVLEEVTDLLDQAMTAIQDAQEESEGAAKDWRHALQGKTKLYEAHIEKAGGTSKALDNERKKLEEHLVQVKKELRSALELAGSWDTAWTSATNLASEMDKHLDARFSARQARAAELTASSEGLLLVSVEKGTSRSLQLEALREIRSSLHAPTLAAITTHIPAHWLVLQLLNPALEFDTGISEEQFDLLRGKLLSLDSLLAACHELVSAVPEDTPLIEYRKSEGDYAPIESISQGQRCTALIALTLLEGNAPVIIDQPEDSLDVRAIWDDVVRKIRHKKQDRQFIFTTHNSTIAVAGDSDCMTILEPHGTTTYKSQEGSIDVAAIKTSAIEHLEGGPEAFQLRRLKYNIPR